MAMWTGPGLIWDLWHLGAGALLLHGGLFATLVLLWRDPVAGERLLASTRQGASPERQAHRRAPGLRSSRLGTADR